MYNKKLEKAENGSRNFFSEDRISFLTCLYNRASQTLDSYSICISNFRTTANRNIETRILN